MIVDLLLVVAVLGAGTPAGDELEVRRLAVAPAETLAVTVAGSGRAVVMVPGLIGSAYVFRHVREALVAAGYRAIVVEPLGTGASARPEHADYSLAAQSVRIGAALDSLGIRAPVLLCHAVGASMCFRLAAQRPELAAGIVSINGGVAERAGTDGLRFSLKFAPVLKLFGAEGFIRGKIAGELRSSSHDGSWVTEAVVRGYTASFEDDVGAAIDALRRMVNAEEPDSLRPLLANIAAPVHLLVGGGAPAGLVPAQELEILRTELADLSITVVPDAGQFIQEERPDAVVEAVLAMLARVDGPPTTLAPVPRECGPNAPDRRTHPASRKPCATAAPG